MSSVPYKVLNQKAADGSPIPIGNPGPQFIINKTEIINPPVIHEPADKDNNRTIFYVSPDGNDENDGQSTSTPYEHISRALDMALITTGKIEIRLAQKSGESDVLNTLYRLSDGMIRGPLNNNFKDFVMRSWDFTSDSSASRNVAICPSIEDTEANIVTLCHFYNINFVGRDYGNNGEPLGDSVGREVEWLIRSSSEFYNCGMVGPIVIWPIRADFKGNTYFTSSSLQQSNGTIIVEHNGYLACSKYNNVGSITIHPRNTTYTLKASGGTIAMVSGNVSIIGQGSATKKVEARYGGVVVLGTNINAIPGTGTDVDSASHIL